MTEIVINDSDRRIQYTASGGQTVFPYDFPIFDEAHLVVTRLRAGVLTTRALTTDYTVSGVGVEAGGNVTLVSGATAGDIITIYGDTPVERTTDFNDAGDFFAATLNREFDLQTQMIQQNERDIARSLRLQDGDTSTASLLPLAAARASKFLAFDSNGDTIAAAGTSADLGPVSPYINALLDDTTLAAALASLLFSADMQAFLVAANADLARAAINARRQGIVTLIRTDPTATDVAWKAYAPNGSLIDISASTTDGFAEAHAYAQANNYALLVEGGGITTAKPNANVIAFLTSTRQTLGPCDSQIYDIKGVNFTFAGQGLTSGTALSVDSFSKGLLNFDGQVVCNHAGTALEFVPSTNHTSDSNKNQGVADFFFRIVENASQTTGAVVVSFNAQTGTSLNGSHYRFEEINGGETGVLFTTVGTGVITGCRFDLWGIHGFLDGATGVGLHIDATGVSACQFNMETSTPASAGYTARINSKSCDYNIFDLTSGAVKILLNTAASKNEIHIFAPNASGLTLTDNSTALDNTVWFNGALIKSVLQIPGGTGQTWYDKSGSRAINTTYTNSTGYPIEVCVSSTTPGSDQTVTFKVGASAAEDPPTITINSVGMGPSNPQARFFASTIVPNGGTYRMNNGGIATWAEFRHAT